MKGVFWVWRLIFSIRVAHLCGVKNETNMMNMASHTGQKLKVLIVEDERLIAMDLKNFLTDWGYHVTDMASSGQEALEIFHEQSPDLVLMDVQLDGPSDGVEIVQKMGSNRAVPVIYLTAQADEQTVERAKKTKPAAYLLKPFDERHLHISIDLAFSNFCENLPINQKPRPLLATEVKLGGEIILKKGNEIFVKQNYRFVKFTNCQITCLEADGNHTFIQTIDQKLIVRIPLSTVLERLADPFLVRVHRSFAININMVKNFSETEITVEGRAVPFSPSFREDFFKNFNVV